MQKNYAKLSLIQTVVFTLIVTTFFWANSFFNILTPEVTPIRDYGVTKIGEGLNSILTKEPIIEAIISLLIKFVNIILVYRIFVRNVIHIAGGHIVMLMYALIYGIFANRGCTLIPEIAAFLLLNGVNYSFQIKKLVNSSRSFFLHSFFISVAAMLFTPSYIAIIIIATRAIIFQRFYHRELISLFVGFMLPIFFLSYYNWLVYDDFSRYSVMVKDVEIGEFAFLSVERFLNASIIKILAILLFSYSSVLAAVRYYESKDKRMRVRNSMIVWGVFLFTIYVITFLFVMITSTIAPIIALPFAMFTSLYFCLNRKIGEANIIFASILLLFLLSNVVEHHITINEIIILLKGTSKNWISSAFPF
ncbi:MAG: hypothetical protein R3Y50_09535 [Rikenellaceae bacterium]